MNIEFFISVKTLVLITIIVFASSGYFGLRFSRIIQVQGTLSSDEGPWQRTRGGKDEFFLKISYKYHYKGSHFIAKEEVSFSKIEDAEEFVKTVRKKFYVNLRDPEKIIIPNSDDWKIYFAVSYLSLLVLVTRFYFLTPKLDIKHIKKARFLGLLVFYLQSSEFTSFLPFHYPKNY